MNQQDARFSINLFQ